MAVLPGRLQLIGQDFCRENRIVVIWMELQGSAGRAGVSIHSVKMPFGGIQTIEVTQQTVGFFMVAQKRNWMFKECFGDHCEELGRVFGTVAIQ